MKLNNKGFMMAEVIVVSAIVLMFLATIYASYSKIYTRYKTRLSYYDTVSLYKLEYYRDSLIENKALASRLESIGDDGFNLYAGSEVNEKVIFIRTSKLTSDVDILITKMKASILNINVSLENYLKYLSTSPKIEANYVMVMENCNVKSETNGIYDDCKYSYIEVYDGTENPIAAAPSTIVSSSSSSSPSTNPETYTVTYVANPPNGKTATGTMSSSIATYGQLFVTNKNKFKVQGWDFDGWTDNVGGIWYLTSRGVWENGNGANKWTWEGDAYKQDIVLTARWKEVGVCCKTNLNTYYYVDNDVCDYSNHEATFWCNGKNGACPDTCS